ncbi:lanthionine synthetase C family protein [Streptomyces sp. ISL-43]|uniref:lanthionine synthetase C family protein n=1 Tax=Streptomyces sp. ISL-43 TaxID=2819183 RepID=UPI001BE98A4D|nr:lanthionine synthetase C family protein [Streptomyces sp. ISL-43]MBT2448817.1 lanthionine synthetase C family protein [Streptomyces sp. ISL-43]
MTTATSRIETTVARVADALADPETLIRHTGDRRAAVSLDGSAGAALFLAELAAHDRDRLPAAHAQLAVAARALAGTATAGLHYGPASVLAAAQACGRLGGHYPRLRHQLTAHVAAEQLARIAAEPPGEGVAWSAYDIIAGTTGTGRLLLGAVTEGDQQERAAAEPALRATLSHLVALSLPITADGHRVPGWWVPGPLQPTGADREAFPRGDFNLGLAHGIAGPLALLALSAQAGVTVDGQLAAVGRIGGWLADRADHDAFGPYWEPRLPFDDELVRSAGASTEPSPYAAAASGGAWCYGAVGIANALARAAQLSGEPGWRRLALGSARALLRRPGTDRHLKGPTVCHGHAGFLQSLWRLGRLTGDRELLDGAAPLAGELAAMADEDAPFAFRHLAPARRDQGWDRTQRLCAEDNGGLLEGAAGVAAALLSLVPGPSADGPHWDRVLLLS